MAIENASTGSRAREALQSATQTRADAPQAERQTEREEAPRRSAPAGRRQAGLSSIARLAPMPISMSNNGQVMEQIRQDFVEALPGKDVEHSPDIRILPINKDSAGLPYSIIIVAGTRKGKENIGVAYHTLVIAGSSDPIKPTTDSWRGEQLRIVPTPDMAYDKKMRVRILEALQQAYPGRAEKEFLSGDAEVVRDGFPAADQDGGRAIAELVKNTLAALQVVLNQYDRDVPELSLDEEDSSYNQIHVQHRQDHLLDRGNLPYRADSVIELVSREHAPNRDRRGNLFEQATEGQSLLRVSGFHDFVYSPHDNARTDETLYRSNRRPSYEDYMFYALRYVITDIDTMDFSLNSMLLALGVAMAAGDPAEILRAFEPNKSIKELDDIRNIGALAYETNPEDNESGVGDLPPTKTSEFTTAKLKALLTMMVHPGMILAMDIPDCSASSWKFIDFMALAEGDGKETGRIYDAMCRLTGDRFADFYGRHEPVIDTHIEHVFNGYYAEGDRRLDIRDIDLLAVYNLSRPTNIKELELAKRWSRAAAIRDDDTFVQSEQYEVLTKCLNNVTITGRSQRVSFDGKFTDAVIKSIIASGISLNPATSGRDSFERERSSYGNLDSILNRSGTSDLYKNQRRGGRERDDDRYSSFGRGRNASRF